MSVQFEEPDEPPTLSAAKAPPSNDVSLPDLFSSHVAEANYNSAGVWSERNAMVDATANRIKSIKQATGEDVPNPYNNGYVDEATAAYAREKPFFQYDPLGDQPDLASSPFVSPSNQDTKRLDELQMEAFQNRLGVLKQKYPEKADVIGADRPIAADARSLADTSQQKAAAYSSATTGLLPWSAGFAGSMVGSFRDPMQAAALFFGGPELKVASVAGKIAVASVQQSLVNAGISALEQPAVQAWRAQRGQENGVVPALQEVGGAALFGAIPGAGIEAGKIAGAAAWRKFSPILINRAAAGDEAAARAVTQGLPKDAVPAAHEAEEAAHLDTQATSEPLPVGLAPKAMSAPYRQAVRNAEDPAAPLPTMVYPPAAANDDALVAGAVAGARTPLQAIDAIRSDPRATAAALASPDLALSRAGQVASLGDEAYALVQAGDANPIVAAEVVSRVADPAEQVAILREVTGQKPESAYEAAQLVSQSMTRRATPIAQHVALGGEGAPSGTLPTPQLDRGEIAGRSAQLDELEREFAPKSDATGVRETPSSTTEPEAWRYQPENFGTVEPTATFSPYGHFGDRTVSAQMHAPEITGALGQDVPGTMVRPFGGPLTPDAPPGSVVNPNGVVAYHGTPHDFDRFDLSKIGTGEGAQAFGHGLYFAESKGLAERYRDTLSAGTVTTTPPVVTIDGAPAVRNVSGLTPYNHPQDWAAASLQNHSGDAVKAAAQVRREFKTQTSKAAEKNSAKQLRQYYTNRSQPVPANLDARSAEEWARHIERMTLNRDQALDLLNSGRMEFTPGKVQGKDPAYDPQHPFYAKRRALAEQIAEDLEREGFKADGYDAHDAMMNLFSDHMSGKKIAEEVQKWVDEGGDDPLIREALKRGSEAFDHLETPQPRMPTPTLFNVRLNRPVDHFLDWDRSLSEQPAHVQSALMRLGGYDTASDSPGALLYKELARGRLGDRYTSDVSGPVEASDRLYQAGIAGIKYLDRSSRRAGEGTSNYVAFRDHDVIVTHKNGMELPAPKTLPEFLRGEAKAAFDTEQKSVGISARDFSGDLTARAERILDSGKRLDHGRALDEALDQRALENAATKLAIQEATGEKLSAVQSDRSEIARNGSRPDAPVEQGGSSNPSVGRGRAGEASGSSGEPGAAARSTNPGSRPAEPGSDRSNGGSQPASETSPVAQYLDTVPASSRLDGSDMTVLNRADLIAREPREGFLASLIAGCPGT